MKRILVTGAAGFIGFHYAARLAAAGHEVYGIDNLNDYYDPALKKARLKELRKYKNFTFKKVDLADRKKLEGVFKSFKLQVVANMAAQAGVRYSLTNPYAYVDSNLSGFVNLLECCRHHNVEHLIFASSSSVYGANTNVPFAVEQNVDHPISLYAATKKANELMAHSYAHLYKLPCTGLRFFTVYGPWGRPDMAAYKFVDALYNGRSIDVFNNGDMRRDFTYVDDIVEAMVRLIDKPAISNAAWDGKKPDPSSSNAPYRLYNIGNNQPENLMDMIHMLEDITGKKAQITMLPMQAGDVHETYANTDALYNAVGFKPSTPLREGLENFVAWYKTYNNES